MAHVQWIFPILLFILIGFSDSVVFPLGSVFDRNKLLNIVILEHAIDKANANTLRNSDIELKYFPGRINFVNEFIVAESVCELLGEGSLAIFGPKSPSPSAHASSICDAKEIPYIDVYVDLDTESKTSNVNLYPSLNVHSQLLSDIVNASAWQDFTVLYEAPNYIKRIAPLLQERTSQGIITVQPLEVGTNFRKILRKVKDLGSRSQNIIIECSLEHLSEILEQALQVGLFTSERSFIVTNLDAQTIDLTPFQYTEAEVIMFRIVQPEEPFQELDGIRDALEDKKARCSYCTPEEIDELSPGIHSTSTALIFDAVMTLAEALKQIGPEHLDDSITRVDCYDTQSSWSKGYTIINFMKNTNYTGLSGNVEFDTEGLRSNMKIDVLKLTHDGLKNVGYFKNTENPRLTLFPDTEEGASDDDAPINEKKFVVRIALNDPYVMLKDTSIGLEGNDRYEGFGIDIIDELSQMYGFRYELVLQEDGNYGKKIAEPNEWNGMIGEVMAGNADLAITDLTINSARIAALDFTPSFMNLGIALLYRKPMQEPPSTFSFMSPFSKVVWVYLGAAYVTVSLCFFCLGRISPAQWENRFPCVEEPEFLENQFTLNNSMWFAIGALLQQGSEIEPKAASIRLASSVWWFFTLIMVSSYTANLAAFLVIENKSSKIDSVDDLANCGIEGFECPVEFGAKEGGATLEFFKVSSNPVYQQMAKFMNDHPEYMTKNNKEAFLMESSSISYETERKCNLTQVGGVLDDKNYGIGMRKKLNTPDALEYNFHPFRNGVFNFKIRAAHDAHLCLSGEPNETHPFIEVFIGGWKNTKSVIRFNKQQPDVATCGTPDILDPSEFRGFWIRVTDGVVTVGREGEAAAILSWYNPEPFLVNYVGVCTVWGAVGSWIIDDSQPEYGWQGTNVSAETRSDFSSGTPCWIPATGGEVPPDAVQGGMDGEPLFVARARHEGDLIPGKLVPSHSVAYVAFGGAEHPHSDYEVLCGCSPHWVQVEGDQIPSTAVPAGETGDGEPLFVGRVHHEGAVTIGKVQPSHGVCYIPFAGQELAFQAYEVLTCN